MFKNMESRTGWPACVFFFYWLYDSGQGSYRPLHVLVYRWGKTFSTYLVDLSWGLNLLIFVWCLEQCLGHSPIKAFVHMSVVLTSVRGRRPSHAAGAETQGTAHPEIEFISTSVLQWMCTHQGWGQANAGNDYLGVHWEKPLEIQNTE